jgi:hypothetical protein
MEPLLSGYGLDGIRNCESRAFASLHSLGHSEHDCGIKKAENAEHVVVASAVDPSVRWPIYDYVSYFDAVIKVLEDEGWIPGFNRKCKPGKCRKNSMHTSDPRHSVKKISLFACREGVCMVHASSLMLTKFLLHNSIRRPVGLAAKYVLGSDIRAIKRHDQFGI